MSDYKTRLDELRQAMKSMDCDAFLIPQGDIWERELPEPSENRFQFICGLNASAGMVIVTETDAVVLIDARYALAAEETIDKDIFEIGSYIKTPPEQWLIDHLEPDSVIGYDAWLHPRKEAKRIQEACNDEGLNMKPLKRNPVDKIWTDRPSALTYKAINHLLDYAGESVDDKLAKVETAILANEAASLIITSDACLAWLLNMRTCENPQSPGVRGFGIFETEQKSLTVFTDVDCTDFDTSQTEAYSVEFYPLVEFPMMIGHFERTEQVIQISNNAPDWFTDHLNAPASEIIRRPDPCESLKAIKNATERDCIRVCQIRDSKAVQRVIHWIDKSDIITEQDVADRLRHERAQCPLFRGESFDPIVSWNANGANIHRRLTPENNTIIEGSGLLLFDSGGQYEDGTTDITRTIAIGSVNEDIKDKYTLVLKAHIALASAVFAEGTTGAQLDAIVRSQLWPAGIDYAHGTGHGVGFFLNVHEGPYGISPRCHDPIEENMLLSNEPGFYKEGHYGIRLENLILAKKYKDADGPGNMTGRKLLCFETVTKVAFDSKCIKWSMLTQDERQWLDNYHASCVH